MEQWEIDARNSVRAQRAKKKALKKGQAQKTGLKQPLPKPAAEAKGWRDRLRKMFGGKKDTQK